MKMLMIFLKGLLMGLCDVIPGISGGTIAFITGIYTKLINSIKEINIIFIKDYFNYIKTKNKAKKHNCLLRAKKNFSRIDLKFFVPLGIGIILAFAIGSHTIPTLTEKYPSFVYSFFTGLIAGSIIILYRRIKSHRTSDLISAFFGFLTGFIIVGLPLLGTDHSLPIIFLSGFIAISAMLLPGISGAFMLLLLGQYEFMLQALKGFDVPVVAAFMVGAFTGLFTFARIMSYLLKKHRTQTMWFLAGLMLGALRMMVTRIDLNDSLLISLVLMIIGFIIVLLLGKFER